MVTLLRGEEKGAAPVSGCLETGAVPFSDVAKGTVPFSQLREKGTAPFAGPHAKRVRGHSTPYLTIRLFRQRKAGWPFGYSQRIFFHKSVDNVYPRAIIWVDKLTGGEP